MEGEQEEQGQNFEARMHDSNAPHVDGFGEQGRGGKVIDQEKDGKPNDCTDDIKIQVHEGRALTVLIRTKSREDGGNTLPTYSSMR